MLQRISVVMSMSLAVFLAHQGAAQDSNVLREAKTFSGIAEKKARSVALFNEAAKVITHARCMNCHPADNSPTQGDDKHRHSPPTMRGDAGIGVAGNTCQACHTESNYTLLVAGAAFQSIPGHPRWAVAPIEMAWQGKSLTEICQQIKDPKRNGNKTLEMLHEHMANDELVGWGWNPGVGREPAPGNQKTFGDLIQAWIDAGAECP